MPLREATAAEYQRRVLTAQLLVQEQLDQPIDVAELARAAHFSVHHFHRVFRAQLGESVMQYVRRLRLERAARKLRAADARLLDLAIEAGYESHEAFTRAFVERFGVPPSRFREQPSERLAAWEPQRASRPMASVRVETFAPLRVAFIRHRGGYAGVHATWDKMRTWAASRGLLDGGPTLYGVCPDDPEVTDEALLRFDACVALDGDGDVNDPDVAQAVLPSGTYAVGMHVGPYTLLHETYLDVIGHWFPTSGYELAPDAVVEHYLNDASSTPEAELRTEVRVRIAD
jgi:AraC family transcriptional regulator